VTPAEAAVAVVVGDSVSRELDDDYVGLWVVPRRIRRELESASDALVEDLARAVLLGLSRSAVRIGTLDEYSGGFTSWPSAEGVERALREWRELGRDPQIGEIGWLVRGASRGRGTA
jgi:hypothetical protein